MITLYGFGPAFGLPEVSPYVTKTEVQLKMAGVPYRKQSGRPPQSPKGQLPYIEDDGVRVADSTFIRAHLGAKYGADPSAWLDPRQQAQAWAIERMVEDHFIRTFVYGRWLIPANFEKGPAHFFDGAPEDVRDAALARVEEALRAQGPARHAPDEVVWLGERSLIALSTMLGDRPYLMGERPCAEDATVFAALAGLLTPFFDLELRRRAASYPNLVDYTARMMRRHYPEHEWANA